MKLQEARAEIIQDMKENGLLINQKPITHAVNVHERCQTEVEILHTKQWFIKYLDIKDELIEQGKKLNWYPEHMRVRYDNWIKGLQWDWCISRQRYFGVPFPVWYCKDCDEIILAEESQLPVDPLKDSAPISKCPKCGCGEFIPEKDIFDTWATSSLSPQINAKWKEDEQLFKKLFPMNLRPQAHDIITFWLFNTVVKAYLHSDSIPWKDCMISGHGLDPNGRKMSKSKGNVVDPRDIMGKYNADCLRFWAAGSRLGDDLPYQEKDVVTGQKTVTKMWNAARFVNMHIEDYKSDEAPKLESIDKWIISKVNSIVKASTESFEKYEYARVKSMIEKFFWHDFCDNYLEICKDRLYNEDVYGKESKESAQFALRRCIRTTLKIFAPIMPYVTEAVYTNLFPGKSIHISKWPEFNSEYEFKEEEEMGELLVDVLALVRKDKSEKSLSLKTEIKILTVKGIGSEKLKSVERDLKMATKALDIVYEDGEDISIETEY